ncbi:MAG: hypothetical protein KBA91_03710 [Candidatus Moranbacteria bacterium]|nr:hypothetical protein [Candidatus Moranbacteria bacterium]
MSLKQIVESRYFRVAAVLCGAGAFALVSFVLGVQVGMHKAQYSYAWGENYERNFGMGFGGTRGEEHLDERSLFARRTMGARGIPGQNLRNAHGLSGTLLSIVGNNIVVADREGKENTVAISDTTVIKNGRNTEALDDLKVNDQVVVVGNPDATGVIKADLIRIFGRK